MVLRDAAWCCVVLRGAVMLHTSLRVVLRDDEPTTHAHAMTTRCEQPPSLLHYLSSLHPTTLPLLNLPPHHTWGNEKCISSLSYPFFSRHSHQQRCRRGGGGGGRVMHHWSRSRHCRCSLMTKIYFGVTIYKKAKYPFFFSPPPSSLLPCFSITYITYITYIISIISITSITSIVSA